MGLVRGGVADKKENGHNEKRDNKQCLLDSPAG